MRDGCLPPPENPQAAPLFCRLPLKACLPVRQAVYPSRLSRLSNPSSFKCPGKGVCYAIFRRLTQEAAVGCCARGPRLKRIFAGRAHGSPPDPVAPRCGKMHLFGPYRYKQTSSAFMNPLRASGRGGPESCPSPGRRGHPRRVYRRDAWRRSPLPIRSPAADRPDPGRACCSPVR